MRWKENYSFDLGKVITNKGAVLERDEAGCAAGFG